MVKPLTGQDAFFIYGETEEQHQHMVGLIILDPSTAPPGRFSVEKVIETLRTSIAVAPEYAMRLSSTPLAVAPPSLVYDDAFDVSNHVRHIAVPAPGNMKQVCDIVAQISGRPLPRARPLWETTVISGLERGRIAIVQKVHHCMSDGVKGARMMAEQFDLEPDPPEREESIVEAWKPAPVPLWDATIQTWRSQMEDRKSFGQMVTKTYKAIASRRKIEKERPRVQTAVPSMFPKAPHLKFNGDIGPERSVAVGRVRMDDLKRVKNHFGVKLNDVALALFALSMRDYLIATEDLPEEDLVVSIPVSLTLRGKNDSSKSNANGNIQAKVPIHIEEPTELLNTIHEYMSEAKHVFEHSFEDLMNGYVSMLLPVFSSAMLKTLFGKTVGKYLPTPTNAVVSNVPGPPIPLYLRGAVLESMYPIGPVMSIQGLNVTLISVTDHLDFSVHASRRNIRDVWPIAEGMERAMKILIKAADGKAKAPKRKKPKKAAAKKTATKKKPKAKKAANNRKAPTKK